MIMLSQEMSFKSSGQTEFLTKLCFDTIQMNYDQYFVEHDFEGIHVKIISRIVKLFKNFVHSQSIKQNKIPVLIFVMII